MAYKTPGVYVEEITTFPPSVVAVETAIPAFVGYTEKALDEDGSSLSLAPTRILSLLDFETRFGGDFQPATYQIMIDTDNDNGVGLITALDEDDDERHYYLYRSLRHFYANGGGPCYIVSVGSYDDEPVLGDATAGLLAGLSPLERFDEPTLLVFPDGMSLAAADLGSLQQQALAQCARLQDRFMITDLAPNGDSAADFRKNVGSQGLRYGAAYYPWIRAIYRPEVRFSDLRLVDTPADPADDPTPLTPAELEGLTGDAEIDGLLPAARGDASVGAVLSAVNGGLGALPPFDRGDFADLAGRFAGLLDELGASPTTNLADIRPRFIPLVRLTRSLALALEVLRDDTALDSGLLQAVVNLSRETDLIDAIVGLIALEKADSVRPLVAASRTPENVNSDYEALDGSPWIGANADAEAIAANGLAAGTDNKVTALAAADLLQDSFDQLADAALAGWEAAEFAVGEAEKQLFARHPVYRDAAEQVRRAMSLLPASGAVAGVYAAVDRTRGVWKAPANVSLADVSGPAVKLDDEDQADLNVHSTGKSINAIRAFAGKGTLVWGARTLAGNDNEWRYVPVRRFFNMAEESIKKATEPFVFEPNDANTWVRARAMIENFLTVQWRQGALAGATPQDAFYVKVGLGETMTALDILEGRMIVEVGMAAVRPAEFIILRFAHKMQVS